MYRTLFFILTTLTVQSQTLGFTGNVKGDNDLDQIHVVNITSKTYGITNVAGDFKIQAKLNDIIIFSSILYQKKEIIVTPTDIKNKYINIKMFSFVNELDEVVIGTILTGNIVLDIKNMGNKKQITFADVGIPGYTGKPLTQNERRLKEASHFNPTYGAGINGGGVRLELNPIINIINGRTKYLKRRVDIETRESILFNVKIKFGKTFFEEHPLEKSKQEEFYFFCSESIGFKQQCGGNNFQTLQFLSNQYKTFLKQIKAK